MLFVIALRNPYGGFFFLYKRRVHEWDIHESLHLANMFETLKDALVVVKRRPAVLRRFTALSPTILSFDSAAHPLHDEHLVRVWPLSPLEQLAAMSD